MKVHFKLEKLNESVPNPIITLGNFDGVHLGHQEIFRVLREEADACSGTTVVVTFEPHPLKVLCPERAPRLITTLEEKIQRIRSCGMDRLLCVPFTQEFATWAPGRFVEEILVGKLFARKVLVGEDFRFGKDRKGDLVYLRKAGTRHGFSVRKIKPVRVSGREASSTRVRYSVLKGLIRESSELLGRPYHISGIVEEGEKRGRELGFPTANLRSEAELLPPNGVYAVRAILGRKRFAAVANLGTKPTFAGSRFCIEVHLFDFNRDIYGEPMRIQFVDWIREERTFSGARDLVHQIQEDAQKAREALKAPSPSVQSSSPRRKTTSRS